MKADHLREFNFFVIHKLAKYKTTNQIPLNHFPYRLSYVSTAYHLPGKNRKVWGLRPISQPCPEHLNFTLSACKSDRNYNLFVGLTGRYTRSQNS
jgi:hypothetical protein